MFRRVRKLLFSITIVPPPPGTPARSLTMAELFGHRKVANSSDAELRELMLSTLATQFLEAPTKQKKEETSSSSLKQNEKAQSEEEKRNAQDEQRIKNDLYARADPRLERATIYDDSLSAIAMRIVEGRSPGSIWTRDHREMSILNAIHIVEKSTPPVFTTKEEVIEKERKHLELADLVLFRALAMNTMTLTAHDAASDVTTCAAGIVEKAPTEVQLRSSASQIVEEGRNSEDDNNWDPSSVLRMRSIAVQIVEQLHMRVREVERRRQEEQEDRGEVLADDDEQRHQMIDITDATTCAIQIVEQTALNTNNDRQRKKKKKNLDEEDPKIPVTLRERGKDSCGDDTECV